MQINFHEKYNFEGSYEQTSQFSGYQWKISKKCFNILKIKHWKKNLESITRIKKKKLKLTNKYWSCSKCKKNKNKGTRQIKWKNRETKGNWKSKNRKNFNKIIKKSINWKYNLKRIKFLKNWFTKSKLRSGGARRIIIILQSIFRVIKRDGIRTTN